MQNDSSKSRRVKVAPGIYRQDGGLFANYREPGNGRSRFTKLQASTIRDAKRERELILAGYVKDAGRDVQRSPSPPSAASG